MDRWALFVDAGYLLTVGAMAVHGTRRRDAVSWDYRGLLELLTTLAAQRTQLPGLRTYWYETTSEGKRAPDHDVLADISGLKLRVGPARSGRREGIAVMAYRDLTTLAREHAVCDAVVVSGDEQMVRAVTDAQDFGMRVTGTHVRVDGHWTISPALRQEYDDLFDVVAAELRPYADLPRAAETAAVAAAPLGNGQVSPGAVSTQRPATSGRKHQAPPEDPPPQPMPSPGPHHSDPEQPPSAGSTRSTRWPRSLEPPLPETLRPPEASQPEQSAPRKDPSHPGGGDQPPQQSGMPTLAEAVRGAHEEGRDFGASVARDAPSLWLEAVLARKPRMPADLDARLMQDSALPMDFLLHDEVRHALRRGFWQALEQRSGRD